jgi:hypothetical protein
LNDGWQRSFKAFDERLILAAASAKIRIDLFYLMQLANMTVTGYSSGW